MEEQDILDSQQGLRLEDVADKFHFLPHHANILPTFVNDTDQVVEAIRKGMSLASNVAGDLEELGHSDMHDDLENVVKGCIDLEHLIMAQKQIFLRLKTEVVQQQRNIGNGMDKHEEYITAAKMQYQNLTNAERYHGHEKYNEFKQLVWSVNHPDSPMPDLDYGNSNREGGEDVDDDDDDDEVVIAATKKSLKCPITTTWLEEPVTSKICRHTFSKDAIFGMIRRSRIKHVECPVPGCRQSLNDSSFFEDTIMERNVARAKEAESSHDRSQFHDVE